MKTGRAQLPRAVLIFGMVSFLNDTASEMVTPILPVFLAATLGAGPVAIGLIEGWAEATSSILKALSGRWADKTARHKLLVTGGYGISNAARPLIGLAFSWIWVWIFRFFDRVGKGLRTAPRDAWVAAAAPAAIRGRAFGFHRAMDHAGATLGPLFAFALLAAGWSMRDVFLISVIPGVLLMLLLVKGLPPRPESAAEIVSAALPRWGGIDPGIRSLVIAGGGLGFAALPEAFLVLWAFESGLEIVWVPLLWSAAHAMRMIAVAVGGTLSDRFGRRILIAVGWSSRIGFLLLMAVWSGPEAGVWLLFLFYAGSTALSEGAERALIGDRVRSGAGGSVFGLYHMIVGLAALPGALVLGFVWQTLGMKLALGISAALVTAATVFFLVATRAGAE